MLKLGMPTLLELPEPEESAGLCAELGLDFLELNMNLPGCQLPALEPDRLRRLKEQWGIGLTIHLDETLNFCDFNPYLAQAACRTVRETLELAVRLEIPVVNLHLPAGVFFTLPQGKVWLFERYRDHYLRRMGEFARLCGEFDGSGVTVCVENCGGFPKFQREALELLLESPVFGLTFDAGHDARAGGADREFLRRHEGRICHLHLHDAAGTQDHLALGDGEADLSGALALASRQDCRVVVEVKTAEGLTRSLDWLRRRQIKED